MEVEEQPFADIESTLKRASAALREANIPFLLGGSLASWARGGPETRHDLDLMIKPEDVQRALEALERVGMTREDLSVLGMELRVMALEDVLVTKLLALTEHALRYDGLLAIARALREQIDWAEVHRRTDDSPFARAFFVMLEGLGIVELQQQEAEVSSRGGTTVRVLSSAASGGSSADAAG